jgi:hypothetical protein
MELKPFAVFLSHNSEDKNSVEKIAIFLEDKANLKPWLDKWTLIPGENWVRALERGLDSSATCAVFVGKNGEGPWQKPEVDRALQKQVNDASFRVIPVLLPDASTKPVLPGFLSNNTWVDFRKGLDDDEALWCLECGIRGQPRGRFKAKSYQQKLPTYKIKDQVKFDSLQSRHPGGTLDAHSRFYIRRPTDDNAFYEVQKHRGVVNIIGPRQAGKSSLIAQIINWINTMEGVIRIAVIDFQSMPEKYFESMERLWFSIANRIAIQIKLKGWNEKKWKINADYDYNVLNFFDKIFEENENPLVICFDETETVFSFPIKDEFFKSIRSYHSRGAMLDPCLGKLRWVLATSTEPAFYIKDLNQSPFNIGYRAELNVFSPHEVNEFSRRHGLVLDTNDLKRIMDYVGGVPYLVHTIFYNRVRHPESSDKIFEVKGYGGKIFREHLERFLKHFQHDDALKKAMKEIIQGKGCKDVCMSNRLRAAGLVRRDDQDNITPQCSLYADFFRKELV